MTAVSPCQRKKRRKKQRFQRAWTRQKALRYYWKRIQVKQRLLALVADVLQSQGYQRVQPQRVQPERVRHDEDAKPPQGSMRITTSSSKTTRFGFKRAWRDSLRLWEDWKRRRQHQASSMMQEDGEIQATRHDQTEIDKRNVYRFVRKFYYGLQFHRRECVQKGYRTHSIVTALYRGRKIRASGKKAIGKYYHAIRNDGMKFVIESIVIQRYQPVNTGWLVLVTGKRNGNQFSDVLMLAPLGRTRFYVQNQFHRYF